MVHIQRCQPVVTLTAIAASVVLARPEARPQHDQDDIRLLRGRVIAAAADARPLPNVRITSSATTEPGFTSGTGEFVIAASATGTLRFTKAGYAPTAVRVSSIRGNEVAVRLARGGAVVGVVVDELGFPVTDARVQVRWAGPAEDAPAGTDYFAETNDAGEYRVGSLAPGRYTVNNAPALMAIPDTGFPGVEGEVGVRLREERQRAAAQVRPLSDLVRVEIGAGQEVPVTLMHRRRAVTPPDAPTGGAVAGVVLDEFGEPVEGVTVRLWQVRFVGDRVTAESTAAERRTDDRGQFRLFHVRPGRYLLAVTDDRDGLAPVYFPGTTVAANALPVPVRKAEVAGVNVTFTRVRESRITGVALDPAGAPLRGTVTLVASRRSGAVALPARVAATSETGAFEFANIAPGEYVVRATDPTEAFGPRTLRAFGAQFVTVAGTDTPTLTVATSASVSISGRIVVEGERPEMARGPFLVTAVADPDTGPTVRWIFEGRMQPDGTFEMPGVAGMLRLAAMAPPGWWVKAITVGGVDAMHEPMLFGPGNASNDVTVVVAPGAAAVNGRVADQAGGSVDDYRVVVFSTDPRRWFGRSPYVRMVAGPGADGGFAVRDLPPGTYWAVAVNAIDGDGDAGEWQDPDVLATLANMATRVTLSQGQGATVALSLRRWNG